MTLHIAQSFAREHHHDHYTAAHLLRALLHKEAGLHGFLQSIGKDIGYLVEWAEVRLEDEQRSSAGLSNPPADDHIGRVLDEADMVRIKLGMDQVTPLCALAALCKPGIGFSPAQLKSFPVKEREILDVYFSGHPLRTSSEQDQGVADIASRDTAAGALYKYTVDKTAEAREGKYDPVIGREREIRMMTGILGRRSKPNVMLTGDPGVGKTALVDGFVQQVLAGHVPSLLREAVVFELNMGTLLAGAAYKGEVEDRLKSILKELKQYPQSILFIDEIHVLLDAKGPVGSGAGNLLKPELARGEITVIGATTLDEFRKIIEPEQAFNRRFEVVEVNEPDPVTATKMVSVLVPAYEQHHGIPVAAPAVAECVRLAKRYTKDKRLPDAAIDLLDRTMSAIRAMNETTASDLQQLESEFETLAGNSGLSEVEARAEWSWLHRMMMNCISPVLLGKLTQEADFALLDTAEDQQAFIRTALDTLKDLSGEPCEEVTGQELAAIISFKTGIPIGKVKAGEKEKLLSMEDYLKKRVVGQDYALRVVSDAVIESRSGVNKAGQPVGSFFFLGPTGTGKTELAKAVAEFLFNDEQAMIRFDMSEFKEEHSAALLYGAPPGYVGYEEGGMLVNKIRQQPYSVVLFDEIEKAHPSVFDIFLQIMDEGIIHDRLGKEGDFSNALIIFTSNVGSEWITDRFGRNIQPSSTELMELMASRFRPEFLARITEIVPFAPISEDNVVHILEIQMRGLLSILQRQGISLEVSDAAKRYLALNAFTPKYGARQISGAIRNQLRRPVSRFIVAGKVKKGDHLLLALDEGDALVWSVNRTTLY